MKLPFYTIGHSTRTLQEFTTLLQIAHVEHIVDIRTVPKSRTNPQYNQTTLPDSLAAYKIGYQHLPLLGGLRGKAKTISPTLNNFWENQSFHNYADYALSDDFQTGLDQLILLGRKYRCAIMCSEAVWWRCHRRIVTDYLLARDEAVFHLMGRDKIETAYLTKSAQIQPSGTIFYPAETT